jgi:REP element-mobilizing transposase RayT
MQPRRKPHRLPDEHYHGQICVAFTPCEQHRKPELANDLIHAAMRDRLARAATKHNCTVPIYTVMPDHMHVLMLGADQTSRPKDAMESFKMSAGRWLRYNRPDLKLQHDFHDHIVRWSEGWRSQARYIALNPCRAGLADHPEQYPYTGSIGYDLNDIIGDAFH